MNAPFLRSIETAVSSSFVSSALRRACISHRQARLASCSARAAARASRSNVRQYATVLRDTSIDESVHPEIKTSKVSAQTALEPGSSIRNYEPIPELDPYLPLELRSQSWLQNLASFEGVRSPSTLPAVILDLNPRYPGGILSYIALKQYRWSAYMYLADALIKSGPNESLDDLAVVRDSPWTQVDGTFPTLGEIDGHVVFNSSEVCPDTAYDRLRGSKLGDAVLDSQSYNSIHRDAMGYLWQSLGHITLASTNHERDYADYMMSHVHRVFAALHHEGRMPEDIYKYESHLSTSCSSKSPFLHLMSARFLGVIADAVWKVQVRDVIEYYDMMIAHDKKTDGPKLWDVEPAVPPIGQEAWLDLILWSCIYEGHTEAAANIALEMMQPNEFSTWSSAGWPDVLGAAMGKGETADARRYRDRFYGAAGESISKDPPIVSLPKRAVSQEVIAALVEALAASPLPGRPSDTLHAIRQLRSLLRTCEPDEYELFVDTVTLDLLAHESLWERSKLGLKDVADTVLSMVRPVEEQHDLPAQRRLSSNFPVEIAHNRAISDAAFVGDWYQAQQVLQSLQEWLAGKEEYPSSLLQNLSGSLVSGGRHDDNFQHGLTAKERIDLTCALLPVTTATSLLDLMFKRDGPEAVRENLPLGNDESSVMIRRHCNSMVIQPILVQLGVACDNYDMVLNVAKLIREKGGNLNPPLLHALFYAHTRLRKFYQAENILSIMSERAVAITNGDVLTLARVVMELEAGLTNSTTQEHLNQARELLRRVLTREFTPQRPFAEPNHAAHRQLNQISRMLLDISRNLRFASEPGIIHEGPGSGGCLISGDDFNILLEAVVTSQGYVAGKELLERWSHEPGSSPNDPDASEDHFLPVVGSAAEISSSCVERASLHIKTVLNPIIRDVRDRVQSYETQTKRQLKPIAISASSALDSVSDTTGVARNGISPAAHSSLSQADCDLLVWARQKLAALGWRDLQLVQEYPEIFTTDGDQESGSV